MKRAWVYAISAVVVVTAGVWLLPHAPRAEKEQETEATLSPLDQKVQEAVAIIQSQEGNPMEAIFKLREVVQEDPNHRDAQFYLGQFSMMSGQWEKAVERFQIVLTIRPDDEVAAESLAQSLANAGRVEGAIQHLESFLTQYPKHPPRLRIEGSIRSTSVGTCNGGQKNSMIVSF